MDQVWLTSNEFTGFANKILQDDQNPALLYLGTGNGLVHEFWCGQSWVRVQIGISVDGHGARFAFAPIRWFGHCHTRQGVYIIDDLSPLRKAQSIRSKSDVLFLWIERRILFCRSIAGNQTWNAGEYNGGNYTDNAVITYYLKDRMASGDAKNHYTRQPGQRDQRPACGKRKGVNRIAWIWD